MELGIKVIKDCTDTVSTTCTQQSVQQSHSSAVVGSDTKVGPSAVVANHGTVSVGLAGGYGTGAFVNGYSGGAILGGTVATGYSPLLISGVASTGTSIAATEGGVVATGYSKPAISDVAETNTAIAEDVDTGTAVAEAE